MSDSYRRGLGTFFFLSSSYSHSQFKRVLGRGSFKTVYAAFDTVDALEVAWNKLHVDRLDEAEKKKIINEVRLLGQINHKNIIRLYDSFTCCNANADSEGSIAFITEQMMSGTLKQYLKMAQNVKLKVIRKWCSNILEAVAYLHERRIMHRDLKLDNLFMNGHVGEVKIGDLGLSAVRDTNQKAESVIGTPEFMAPELYEEAYTEKVDIYAFGMCLLEMVTMEYPYAECKGPAQIMKKVFNNERPASFHRLADSDVKRVIAQCLEREANRPSAAELLQHPLFRDWESDDGKRSNLSLIQDTMSLEILNGPEESNELSEAIANAPTIAFSEQLNRDVLVETREATETAPGDDDLGISVTPANMGGVAGGVAGGLRLELQWPFEDALKSVSFCFNPGDRPDELAGEMVAEFGLAPSQHSLLTEAIDAKVKEMTIVREREQEIFARSPRLYGLPTASTGDHVTQPSLSGGGEKQRLVGSGSIMDGAEIPDVNSALASDVLQADVTDPGVIKLPDGSRSAGMEVEVPPRSSSVPPPVNLPTPPSNDVELHSQEVGNLSQSRSRSVSDAMDESLRGEVGVHEEPDSFQGQERHLDSESVVVGHVEPIPLLPNLLPQRGEAEPADVYAANAAGSESSFDRREDGMTNTPHGQILAVDHIPNGHASPASPRQPAVTRSGSTVRSIVVVGGAKKIAPIQSRSSTPADAPSRPLTSSVSGDVLANSHELMAGALLAGVSAGIHASASAGSAVTPVSSLANASLPPPGPALPATVGDSNAGLAQRHSAPHHSGKQPTHHQDVNQYASQPQPQQQSVHPSLASSLQSGAAAGVHISASSPSNLSIRTASFRSAQSDDSNGLSSSLLSPAQSAPVPAAPVPGNGVTDSDYDQKWYTMCLELMHNASRGRFALVKQKLAQGASVTFADYDKRTPLHLAAAAGSLPTVNVLIENGANVNALDRWGGTPLRDAVAENHNEVAVRLREAGALDDEDSGDDAIDKPSIELIQFSSRGNLDAVKERVSSGVPVTVSDYEQRTPLHLACSHGHAEVADFLLLNGADPWEKDKAGRTPIDNAARNGHRNVLAVLQRQERDAPIRAFLNDNRSPTVATIGPSSTITSLSVPSQPPSRPSSSGVWTADKDGPTIGEEASKSSGPGRPKSSPNQFNQEQLALLQTQAAISHSISMGHIGIGSDGFADARDNRGRGAEPPSSAQYPGSSNPDADSHLSSGLSSQSLPVVPSAQILPVSSYDAGSPPEHSVEDAEDASVREEIERERCRYEQERRRLDAEYRAKIEGLSRKTAASASNRNSVDYNSVSSPGGMQVGVGLSNGCSSDQLPPRSNAQRVVNVNASQEHSDGGGFLPAAEFAVMALDHQSSSRPSTPDPSTTASLYTSDPSSVPAIQVRNPHFREQSVPASLVQEMVEDSFGDVARSG